jgi:predicted RNase H-like nuclease (RuvC/YqgF family)
MNASELADKLEKCCLVSWGECTHEDYDTDIWTKMKSATMLRQQQVEIDRLNYDLEGFKQNFFVSGFHLQIKMANEQLVKQQDEIDALKKKKKDLEWKVNHREVDVDSLRTSLHDAKHQWNKETKKWIPKVEIEKQYLDRIAELEKAKTLTEDIECQYCKKGCIRCDARKLLTDEEIIACIDESEPDTTDMIRFARAILRKASEK